MRLHTRAFSLLLALFMGVITPGWSLFGHYCRAMGRSEVTIGGPETKKKHCCTDTTATHDGQTAKVKPNCCNHSETHVQLKKGAAIPDSTRVKTATQGPQAAAGDQPLRSNFELDFLVKVYDFVIHLFDDSPQNKAGRSLVLFLQRLTL